jgi:hypothetical protein
VVLKFTAIPEEKIMAYQDLTPAWTTRVDANTFRNGMALIDTSGGGTLYGADGIAYIFSSQYKVANFLLSFRPLLKLFSFVYNIQAYNRYIIATPKSRFQCDCLPDRVVQYRVAYSLLTALLSVFLTVLFGISLRRFFPGVSATDAAVQMLLMAGSGWVCQMLVAAVFMRDQGLDYIGHLGSIMVVGLLILVPWILVSSFCAVLNPYLPGVSVLISSGYMLYLHVGRIYYLQRSQVWTISWFLLLQATAFFWVWFFHFT